MALPETLVAEFDRMVQKYPERRSALIPAIHRCQEELGGWVSPETMEDLAAYFGLEPVDVYGVVTFYPMFRTKPPGKHVVSVCHNISCDLRGAEGILAKVCEVTGAKVGGTSADGKFTVERVECQGACANAPMFDLDGVYHEDLDDAKVAKILGGLQ
ncbi:MAG: NAD(P)H-dependent oxidoreductase subunit E [Planctomycetes bacterium]|nr:NAD(P)H-dependent oxidoreductase subunit E [Planctomycetota bacterium]MCB9903495.1 NAD(P)H-dependent oxidoreductase subunit E [Planctomycetota bacterium]